MILPIELLLTYRESFEISFSKDSLQSFDYLACFQYLRKQNLISKLRYWYPENCFLKFINYNHEPKEYKNFP